MEIILGDKSKVDINKKSLFQHQQQQMFSNNNESITDLNFLLSHHVCNKLSCHGALESGIGSSISSMDMHWLGHVNQSSSVNSIESEPVAIVNNTSHAKYDCHDLTPVSEEELDSDCIIGVFNKSVKSNKNNANTHLDRLPWKYNNNEDLISEIDNLHIRDDYRIDNRFLIVKSDYNSDGLTIAPNNYPWLTHCVCNDLCTVPTPLSSCSPDDCIGHLDHPWTRDTLHPLLSSQAQHLYNTASTTGLRADNNNNNTCHNHLSCLENDNDIFYPRQSLQNGKLMNLCESRANIFEEDNNEERVQIRANERVIEWLKLISNDEFVKSDVDMS